MSDAEDHSTPIAGSFGGHQLVTPAPAEALAFYRDLLGWRAEAGELQGAPHHQLYDGDEQVASILGVPADTPGTLPHWHPQLRVDDLDACLDRVEDLGGQVVVEPVDLPDGGRLAVIQDPGGAVLTLVAAADEELDIPDAVDVDGD